MGLPDRLAARLSLAEQHDILRKLRLSRRGALAVGAGAGIAAVVGGGLAIAKSPLFWHQRVKPPGHLAVPFGRHLAFGADPRTQMRVGWQVPLPVGKPFIRYGDSPQNLSHKLPAELRALHSSVPGAIAPVDQYYLHAALDGLDPGRAYYYAVGHDGYDPADLTAFGRIDAFHTAPPKKPIADPFTFTAFGDQGVSPHSLANDGIVAAQRPVFHLHAGDIAYADSSGSGKPVSADGRKGTDVFDPLVWDSFMLQTESIAASVPWMVATGNHDMEALYSPNGYGGHEARFDFPGNGPAHCPSVYSYVYGNVGVIALDANDVSYEVPPNLGYTKGAQTSWLEERLRSLRARPDVDFIVVFFHQCAYSTTKNHASEGGVRTKWVPLFDKYTVDLVVNGHNHIYERADALREGKSTKTPIGATTDPARDGVTYVTAGAAGRGLYEFPVPDSYAGHVKDLDSVPSYVWAGGHTKVPEKVAWSRVRYTGYSFLAVDVRPAAPGRRATLTLRALTSTGAEIDHVTIARTVRG
jgi:hypothetical protein